MKIKRTLPSVSRFFSSNRNYSSKELYEMGRPNTLKRGSQSVGNSKKMIFPFKDRRQKMGGNGWGQENCREKDRKKNGILLNSTPVTPSNELNNIQNQQNGNLSRISNCKPKKRIFGKEMSFSNVLGSRNLTNTGEESRVMDGVVPSSESQNTTGEIKLKAKRSECDESLVRKVEHLQHIVKQIQTQLSSRHKQIAKEENIQQEKTVRKFEEYSNYDHCQKQLEHNGNNLHQMQLQRIRRCQTLAQENEKLYGQLMKDNKQVNQNYTTFCFSSSTKKLGNEGGNNRGSRKEELEKKCEKKRLLTQAFFDQFDQFQPNSYKNQSKTVFVDEVTQIEIPSPFLVQQNRGELSKY